MSLSCSRCPKSFGRQSSLNRHYQVHHSETKERFSCKECFKTFARRDLLRRHDQMQHRDGRQPCWRCRRPFRSDYLSSHLLTCERNIRKNLRQNFTTLEDDPRTSLSATPKAKQTLEWHEISFETAEFSSRDFKTTNENGVAEQTKPTIVRFVTTGLSCDYEYEDFVRSIEKDNVTAFEKRLENLEGLGLTFEKIDFLIKSYDRHCFSVLCKAAEMGSENIIRYLLHQKSHFASYRKKVSLHTSCRYGQVMAARLLLNAGAECDGPWFVLEPPLCVAARMSNLDLARLLLDYGTNVDGEPEWTPPLEMACERDDFPMTELLLSRGANANIKGGAPLAFAIKHASAMLVKLLLRKGALVDLLPKTSFSDLLIAEIAFQNGSRAGNRWYQHATAKLTLLKGSY